MLGRMEPHDLARYMALFYVAGILVAAVIFRVVRHQRKRGRRER